MVIVENRSAILPTGSTWTLGPADFELGGDTTDGAKLTDVGFVSLMSDGRLVVTDVGADAVLLYNPETGVDRVIARKGKGPGEVSRVFQAWVARGDTIVTWDFGNRRLQFFAPDGTYLRAVSLAPGVGGASTFPIGPLPNGNVLAVSRIGQVPELLPPGRDSAMYLRLGADSLHVLDTVAILPDLERYTARFVFGGQNMAQRQVMPFGHATEVFTTANGYVVADNASWELREYDEAGRLKRVIRRTATPPRPVTPDDVDAYRQMFEEAMRADHSMPPDLVAQLIEDSRQAPHATTMPVFGGVTKASDGSFWVRHYDPLQTAVAEKYSVVDSTGRYLGDITLPPNTHLAAATGRNVFLLGSSESGAAVVRRHPILK